MSDSSRSATATVDDQPAGPSRAPVRPGDAIFKWVATGSGIIILAALALVAIFLVYQGLPAFTADQSEVGFGAESEAGGTGVYRYIGPLLFGTVIAATIGLLISTPLAIGIALFISHYAPRRMANFLGYVIDLLAAVPSIIIGLWGIATFAPFLVPLYRILESSLGFIPLFEGPVLPSGRTMLTAGLVLGIMILPIQASVTREAFLQTPRLHEEAALAMGATRWEMIRLAVLPYGRGGAISGAMLALGRALGETLAVALVLSAVPGSWSFNLLSADNPSTIAANIALFFPEATGLERNELVATGLALFVLTFIVNYAARSIAARGSSGGQ